MHPKLITLLASLMAWLLAVSPAHTEDQLRIGVTSGSPPYVYSIEDGKGLDMDILRAIVARMGLNVTFLPVPFARRSLILRDRKVDAVTFWTMPKDVTCYAGQPYRYWRNALFSVRRKNAAEALAPMNRIGIFKGSEHLSPQLKAIGLPYEGLQQVSTINTAVRMMLYERLDGYIGDYPTVVYNFAKEDPKGAFVPKIEHFFPPMPQRLCFAEKAMALNFDTALQDIIQNDPETLSIITRGHGLSESITPPLTE